MRVIPPRAARWLSRRLVAYLAGRALSHAVYGNCARGHAIAHEAIDRSGLLAAETLAAVWCEAIAADIPRKVRKAGRFKPVFVNQVGADMDMADAPTEAVWMTRLVCAHAARDRDMAAALVAAVPPDRIETHLKGLLHAAAIAVVARAEQSAL